MGSERVDERDIGGVAASRDNDPANPRDIVAGIDNWHADIAKMAVHVTSGDVEASAKCHREMGEIAAHSNALAEGFKRGSCRARVDIVELMC